VIKKMILKLGKSGKRIRTDPIIRLVDKGILKTHKRGEYIIPDKMLGEYLQWK